MKNCNYPDCFHCTLSDCEVDISYKAQKQREYNARHPERAKESNRKYYQKNKNTEAFKARNRENQKRFQERRKVLSSCT